jgi:hypothetical protein
METRYTAVAYAPWKGMALRSGSRAYLLEPDGKIEERFAAFPEACVFKYGYTQIKPFEGTVAEILEVIRRLDNQVKI